MVGRTYGCKDCEYAAWTTCLQACTPHLRTYVGILSIDTLSLMQLVVDPALLNTPAAFEVS